MLLVRGNSAVRTSVCGRLPLRAISKTISVKPGTPVHSLHGFSFSAVPSFRTFCAPPGNHRDAIESSIDSDVEKVRGTVLKLCSLFFPFEYKITLEIYSGCWKLGLFFIR
jgi:hypothetical protein